MRLLAWLLIALTMSADEVYCARILCVFPIPSLSHQIFFQPIGRELSLRGHEVVVATTDPLKDKSLINLTEIDLSHMYEMTKKESFAETMAKELGVFAVFRAVFDRAYGVEQHLFEQVPELKAIVENKHEHFDLIIMEGFFQVMYGLAHRFKAPIITGVSLEPFEVLNDFFGVPSHPVLYPCHLLMFQGELTISEKIKSVAFTLYQRLLFKFHVLPRADKLARKYFGDDMPYIGSLMKNNSAVFINRNIIFNKPRALAPNYVELNQMHIKPVQPLPNDLKVIMDNATKGIIYFSLGSNVLSSKLSPEIKNIILGTLSELPYKVLWKFETDDITDIPKNVITRKWFPQQDVLAHTNLKAFVTQGGIQSLEEAISRGVPVIGLPFFGDQHTNMEKVVKKGMGLWIEPTTVTKEALKELIIEVAENKQYREKVKEMRELLVDQPMNSTEKIIWWTEFILRHKGAAHLRSTVLDASFVDYYLLDVIAAIFVIPSLLIYVIFHFLKQAQSRYRRKLKEMHQLLLDQPMNSTEKIIWWTEYVLRHKGASHLRSPVLDTSFIEYYLLDVLAVVLLAPVLIIYFLFYLLKRK